MLSLPSRQRRLGAVTITEMLVACFICSVLLTAMAMFFLTSQRIYGKSSAANFLGRDARVAIETLQRDLEETTLSSVRSHGNLDKRQTGLSMIAPRSVESPERFAVSNYGTPWWQSYVYYTLEPLEDPRCSRLVRTMVAIPAGARMPAPAPWPPPPAATHRSVLLTGVLSTGYYPRVRNGSYEVQKEASAGGFLPTFVRRESHGGTSLSWEEPGRHTDRDYPGWSKGSTGLVRIQLALVSWTAKSELNYLNYHLLVAPAN